MDILRAAARYSMFSPGDRVLAAVSGGADSVVMLHALHAAAHDLDIWICTAHLNHSIRGEAADGDAAFTADLAVSLGLPFITEQIDVPSLKRETRTSLEEAARDARHRFLQRAAEQMGANKIALGHTADDRAESVLLNVIRGSGIRGLGSIRPVSNNIVRPLIETTRAEIEDYAALHKLSFRTDHTNLDPQYTRNRIRLELLPLLKDQYNPRVSEALLRLAEIADMTSDLSETLARSAATSVGYGGAMDADMLAQMPPALRYEVIRREIERYKGDLNDVSYEQISRVVEALDSGADFVITLPSGNLYAERTGIQFRVRAARQAESSCEFDEEIAAPGITILANLGLTFTCEAIQNPAAEKLPADQAMINVEAVSGRLRVRNCRPGDRIVPFGMVGSKKLQDVFVDSRVPREKRRNIPVLTDDEKILWIVGVVRAEHGRVTEATRRALKIRVDGLE